MGSRGPQGGSQADGAASRRGPPARPRRAQRGARLRHLPWPCRLPRGGFVHGARVPVATATADSGSPSPARAPRSPRAGRRGRLDRADAQAVGRVLQGLQLLLVRLVVPVHGAAGELEAGGRRTRGCTTIRQTGSGRGRAPRGGALRLRARPGGRGAGITPGRCAPEAPPSPPPRPRERPALQPSGSDQVAGALVSGCTWTPSRMLSASRTSASSSSDVCWQLWAARLL